jgi:trimeric autotransporter adhesin
LRPLSVVCAVSLWLAIPAHALTRTWTGAASANWSNPANWSPSGVPDASDSLVFPYGASHTTMTNDLPSGTSFGAMTSSGVYTLNGNPLTLTANVTTISEGSLLFGANSKVGAALLMDGSVGLSGPIDINGQTLTARGAGFGVINGSGTIISQTMYPSITAGNGNFSGTISGGAVDLYGALPNATISVQLLRLINSSATVGDLTITPSDIGYASTGPGGVLHTKSFALTGGELLVFVQPTVAGKIQATGTVTLNGTLSINLIGLPAAGQQFTIIDNASTGPVNGTFKGLPEGAALSVSGQTFYISYRGGDGNDVVLTVGFPPIKTWTGAAGANWSNAGNWSPPSPPAGTEPLSFPAGASNRTMVNDLPSGTSFGAMTFSGVYTLNGNPLTLTANVTTISEGALNCSADLKVGAALLMDGSVGLSGPIDINGQTLTAHGTAFGVINGSGTIISQTTLPSISTYGNGNFSGTISGGAVDLDGSLPNATITVQILRQVISSATVGDITITPSDSGYVSTGPAGVLHTKSLTLTGGGLSVFVQPTVAGKIQAAGTVTVNGRLGITLIGPLAAGQQFTIIDNDGTDPVSGTFTGLPEGGRTGTFKISYKGGDGNDVVLTAASDTSASLTQSAATTVIGEPLTLTAAITSSSGTPAGVVTFTDGATTLGTSPIVNGVAQLTTSALGLAAHNIVATYAGEGAFFGSTSAPLMHFVQGHATVTLTASQTSLTFGSSPKLTINVKPVAPAVGMPGGTITLRVDGSAAGGPTTLTSGGAAINDLMISAGQHSITAAYSGNNDFIASESGPVVLSVAKAATTIAVHADQNPAPAGSPVLLSITVTAAAPVAPAGTVVVTESGKILAQQSLNGTAIVTLAGLDPGPHEIAVAYSGNDNFNASGATLTETVSVPSISIDDVVIPEGDSGLTPVHVTLHLSAPSTRPVSVNWTTANGSASSGEDYQPGNGSVTFAPGETSHELVVSIIGDTIPEDDESFFIDLTNPLNATIDRARATIVIKNDDPTYKKLTFTYADPLTLDLYLPVIGAPPYPIIVWVPGFISYDSDATVIPALRETLRGYAVAVVRYRNPAVGRFPAQLDDLKSSVRWLRASATQYGLDAQHIGVWGNGAGAHLAALLGTAGDFTPARDNSAFSAAVEAVVDWNGASDLGSLNGDATCTVIDHDSASSSESLLLGCALQTCLDAASAASPLSHVRGGDPPFLIMHAGFDCYIAPNQSQKLYTALVHAGVDATLNLYENVAHIDPFWSSAQAFAVVDAFLDAKLRPRPSRGRGVRH